MPVKAKTPCRHAGCAALVAEPGYCDQHRRASYKAQKQVVTEDYKERNRFYQRSAWKNVRAIQLQIEPLCRQCRRDGRFNEAKVVDHVKAIADGGDEFDFRNLQSLCKPCHNAKTRTETRRPWGGAESLE